MLTRSTQRNYLKLAWPPCYGKGHKIQEERHNSARRYSIGIRVDSSSMRQVERTVSFFFSLYTPSSCYYFCVYIYF